MICYAVPGFRDRRHAQLRHPDEMAAIDAFNDRLQATAIGFSPAASARRARPPSSTTAGSAMITDGPFVESKEYLAGFWIIEAVDLDVVLEPRRRRIEGMQPEGRGAPVPASA